MRILIANTWKASISKYMSKLSAFDSIISAAIAATESGRGKKRGRHHKAVPDNKNEAVVLFEDTSNDDVSYADEDAIMQWEEEQGSTADMVADEMEADRIGADEMEAGGTEADAAEVDGMEPEADMDDVESGDEM